MRSEPSTVTGTGSYQSQTRGSAVQGSIARLKDWELAWGIALVFFVAAMGVLLTAQGWRSRSPAHDLVPHIINVRNLVTTGTIPVHGDTGSYGSYKLPGTAWLMLPSTLLFSDPLQLFWLLVRLLGSLNLWSIQHRNIVGCLSLAERET